MPKILLLLTDEQHQAIQAVKKADGIPVQEFIRRAVDAALARREAEKSHRGLKEWNRR